MAGVTAGLVLPRSPPGADLDAGEAFHGILDHMTTDPRSALNRLIAAFEAHLDAAATGDEESPSVVAAEEALQDAFFTYDDALFTATGIELPFDIVDADGEDEDDFDEDDLDDEGDSEDEYDFDDEEDLVDEDDFDEAE